MLPRPSRRFSLWLVRFGWLVAIWLLSVAALGVVATLLHWLMRAAGMR